MSKNALLFDRDNNTEWITFNRPEKLNCLTKYNLQQLNHRLKQIASNENIRSVIFTGSGEKAFSSGLHFKEFDQLAPEEARGLITDLKEVCECIRTIPQVVIMAINGHCIGGAMEMAMAADIRIASKNAVFSMPEINLGIPSVLDSVLLQKYVGFALAKEMLLTGDPIHVERINQFGFLNEVVESSRLHEAAENVANKIADKPFFTVKQQKEMFETWQNNSLACSIQNSIDQFSYAFTTDVPQRRLKKLIGSSWNLR